MPPCWPRAHNRPETSRTDMARRDGPHELRQPSRRVRRKAQRRVDRCHRPTVTDRRSRYLTRWRLVRLDATSMRPRAPPRTPSLSDPRMYDDVELLPETRRLWRDPERTCEVLQADDGSRIRDLRLGKPERGVRFQYLRAIPFVESVRFAGNLTRKVARDVARAGNFSYRCPDRGPSEASGIVPL
jgi:hypothetical protein